MKLRAASRGGYRTLLAMLLAASLLAGTDASHAEAGAAQLVESGSSASHFGRLFHTAAERRQLDLGVETGKQALPPAALPAVRVDGIVRSSAGTITVWLDGHPLPLPSSLLAAPHPAVELQLPQHARQRLRAGDRWQPGTTDVAALRQLRAAEHRLPPALGAAINTGGGQ